VGPHLVIEDMRKMRGDTPASLSATSSTRLASRREFVATFALPAEQATLVLMKLLIRRGCSCLACRQARRLLTAVDTGRHAPIAHIGGAQWIKQGHLTLDCSSRRAYLAGADLHVTCHQFRLLRSLCAADGERIFAHIRRIRRRIEKDPSHPSLLITVRGEGFRLTT
jgi:hypothetical protein